MDFIETWGLPITFVLLFLIYIFRKMVIIVSAKEYAIQERLGQYHATLNAGWHFLLPFVDRIRIRDEIREEAIDIPPQTCITKDNIEVEVDGIVYLQVQDPQKAVYEINDYRAASINLAQTTMRSEIGKLTLDETFSERERINRNIVEQIDEASDPWGVKIKRYEIMNISPSYHVIETMEKQMEAERAKRAEITISEGKKEAQIQLSQAKRQESINISEGEKQKRINEAEGQAEEIRLIAEATAQGIQMIAEAIQKPGGKQAVKNQLIERYLETFGDVVQKAQISVLPTDLAHVKGLIQSIKSNLE